jgi:hypothetical protein
LPSIRKRLRETAKKEEKRGIEGVHAPIRETQEQDEVAAEELQLQQQRSFGCAFWWERREEELKVKYCSSRICW